MAASSRSVFTATEGNATAAPSARQDLDRGGGRRAFVVTPSLRRRKVDVLWDPHDLSSVLIYFDGRRIERALPQRPGEAPVTAPTPPTPPAMTLDYLELLRRDHARRRLESTSSIRFQTAPDASAPLVLTRLLAQVATCCGRALGDVERALVATTLESLAPLEIALADTALKIAVAHLGHGLHAATLQREWSWVSSFSNGIGTVFARFQAI